MKDRLRFTIEFERRPRKLLSGWYRMKILTVEPKQRTLSQLDMMGDVFRKSATEFYWRICFQVLDEPAVKVWQNFVIDTPAKKRSWMRVLTLKLLYACGFQPEESESKRKFLQSISPEDLEEKIVDAKVEPRVEADKSVKWHALKDFKAVETDAAEDFSVL